MRSAIGIDIGGTFIKSGVVDAAGRCLCQRKHRTSEAKSRVEMLDLLEAIAREHLREFPDAVGLGIGCPGLVDFERGVVLGGSPNLPEWEGVALKEVLEARLGKRVEVENDANAYVWGEYCFGAGREMGGGTMIGLTLGTGVGGGVVVQGQLYRGAHGFGGELGHLIVSIAPDAPVAGNGIRGSLEAFVGVRAIDAYVEANRARWPKSPLNQEAARTTDRIFGWAEEGDAMAQALAERFLTALSAGVACLISVFDPDLIVLGGGLAQFDPRVLSVLDARVRKQYSGSSKAAIPLKKAEQGSEETYLGAAALVMKLGEGDCSLCGVGNCVEHG